MQSVSITGIEDLNDDFGKLLKRFPKMKRNFHEKAADILKRHVDNEINKSDLNDSHGKIRGWQVKYVGSKGGYAAIRATDTSSGKNSPGAITNYLENGHKIRKPSGKNKYYKRRVKKIYVDGFHFYARASKTIENDILSLAEQFADDIASSFNQRRGA